MLSYSVFLPSYSVGEDCYQHIEESLGYYRHYPCVEERCDNADEINASHHCNDFDNVWQCSIPACVYAFFNFNDKIIEKQVGGR